ncbi:hypothetical protein B0T16DRAFT_421464 [Cercophora newfieldiana]|uniref:Uncharacterized protein n=1 Tax=Cercophora newfieldiana TaxID=92897 RepID=A0AA39XR78_9PEZI|nr:hypothetical protein B0T16DRAFT_421464 [Cercophora newfieldiana]
MKQQPVFEPASAAGRPSNPPTVVSSIDDLSEAQRAMCDDLLSHLAEANMATVNNATLERRRARLWARVFNDWDTDCRIKPPTEIEPRERFPKIKRPNPGLTMEQMRRRAMAHWNRGEIQRVSQHNIELVVYWARRRIVREIRVALVVAHPSIFTRQHWLIIPGEEDVAELVPLVKSEEFVREYGWATEETIGSLRHVEI